jgi:hypothetical protein
MKEITQSKQEALTQEKLVLTPENFKKANEAPEAERRSKEHQLYKDEGELFAVITCGDARLLIPCPERISSLRSINLGGNKDKKIFLAQGTKFVVAMAHFGEFVPGKMPKGCGGAAAKQESMKNHHEGPVKGLEYYVEKKIEHPDQLVQAILKGKEVTRKTGKASLVVAEDHRTGKIYPYAIYTNEYNITHKKFDEANLYQKYNEAEIYSDGIPALPENIIPEKFQEFLNASKDYMETMLRAYPNLSEIQKVQNPRMVFISSKLPSVRVNYPELTNVPNSIFKLHLTREKDQETGETDITPEVLEEIVSQAMYPIGHAVENYGKPDEPFSSVDRVIIEMSDIKNCKKVAESFVKELKAQEWLTLPDRKIIVIQNKEGIANIADYYGDQPRIKGL